MIYRFAPMLLAIVEKPFGLTDAIEKALKSRGDLGENFVGVRVMFDSNTYIVEIMVTFSATPLVNIYMIVEDDCECDDVE